MTPEPALIRSLESEILPARTSRRVAPGSDSWSSVCRSIRATSSLARLGLRGSRVMSRNSPSASMQCSCQRQADGLEGPARRIISTVSILSQVGSTTCARQTCLCSLFRSATIFSSRARSANETKTQNIFTSSKCSAGTISTNCCQQILTEVLRKTSY